MKIYNHSPEPATLIVDGVPVIEANYGAINDQVPGVGPDAPIVENDAGGRQSACPASLVESFPHLAVLMVGRVVQHGLERYEPDNWRKIGRRDHINHALVHAFAYLAGDRQDDHLEHAATRLLFALETE